jgi:hypothetical protein
MCKFKIIPLSGFPKSIPMPTPALKIRSKLDSSKKVTPEILMSIQVTNL